jgi:type I restriction enzyme S subunit
MSTTTTHIEKKKVLAPKLRFKGFDTTWENKKLGEIINNKSAKYNPDKEIQSFKCIELEHLSTNSGQLLGYIDSINSASIKNKFEKGDVLFGKLRPYLRKYLQAPFDGVCSSEIWVLKGENVSNDFLYKIVQTDYFIDLANQSTGSKMPRADWNVVSSGIFHIPTLPEQQKIASFLSAIDEKIQQLKRKKELLEQYKKGVMQQLFCLHYDSYDSGDNHDDQFNQGNQKNHSKSQFRPLRFKDENGKAYPKWEEKRLGDVAVINMGQSPDSNSYNNQSIGMLLIQGNADISGRVTNPRQWTSKPTKKCEIGDLILTVRAPVGSISKSLHNACIGRGVCSIKNNKASNIEYLYQFLLDYEDKWKRIEQGSTFTAVNGDDIKSIRLKVPSLEEQQKIASYLTSLDTKIESVATQITQSQTFKKGLLQQMFV